MKRLVWPIVLLIGVGIGLASYFVYDNWFAVRGTLDRVIQTEDSTDSEDQETDESEGEIYTNSKYGFALKYQLEGKQTLDCGDAIEAEYPEIFICAIGVPETDAPGGWHFRVMRDKDLDVAISRTKEERETGEAYTQTSRVVNGIKVAIFKTHQEFADANIEIRIGKLASGYVFEAMSDGPFQSEPDLNFLDSISNLK
jgi:hypothetical protein